MSYQYHSSTTYQTYTDSNPQLGIPVGNSHTKTIGSKIDSQNHSALSLGAIGDILTGTILQGGDSPIVEMNGTPIQVRSDALKQSQKGEQIYLQITQSTSSEITMKIIDQKTVSTATRNGSMQTEIMKNTAQFVKNWKQFQKEQNPDTQSIKEDTDYILQGMTSEEKAKLRQMGIDISGSNLTVVKSLLMQIRGKEQDADLQRAIDTVRKQIIMENPQKKPEEFQITIQEQTLSISSVTEEANGFLPITEEQSVYLIQNNLSLNLENLYKAQYSGKSMPIHTTIAPSAFQQMQPQIERALQAAGMEITEDNLNSARFLLDHNLPVNTDSLLTYAAIQDINEHGFSASRIQDNLVDATAEQLSSPSNSYSSEPETEFTFGYYRRTELYFSSPSATADQIKEDMKQITEQGFQAFSQTGLPYTLDLLSAFCRNSNLSFHGLTYSEDIQSSSDSQDSISFDSKELTALTAHRQLEEIRLKMTWEASYTLATEDIHIRTKELSEVVDALRNQERDYYSRQFQRQGIEPTTDMLRLTQDANRKMQDLPYLPASALSATYFSGSFTIERLYENGTGAINRMHTTLSYTQVNSYETLMTRPRSDMGDSIQKAFRNVDDILEDMNLPTTEDNQRAVRILGYNQMEITSENLEQIKAADQQVQRLIQNLQPSIVLNLVRDGINPLNMPIQELNTLVQNYINEEGIADEGKYSEFLQKLDRKKGISQEERQGYIGIYRLLDKVSKSKGKDIGTLVRNGQVLTLQNLLTAHRSNRSTGMNTTVDQSFGSLESEQPTNSIDTQIEEAFSGTVAYNHLLTEQLFHRITPDLIAEMTKQAATGMTLEEFFDTVQEQLTDETSSYAAPEEQNQDMDSQQEINEMLLQNLDTLPEETFHFMNTMDIFPSITNLILSADILRGNNRTFRDIERLNSHVPALSEEASPHHQMSEFAEHLNSPEEMEAAYAKLEATVTETVHQADETGTITAMDIQALKQVRSGLRIMQKMSRKEQFEIPFSVNGQWNVMHLSVIQGKEETGRLEADIPNTDYGTLSASLTWKETHWEGSFYSDTREGTVFLEQHQKLLSDALDTMSATIDNAPTTNDMYRMAKQLVVIMKQI